MVTVEDLTKTQIILLTLLISFITSIATGIITTSLLAQAPQSVTQTIDRVIEHTVEKVVPSATSTNTVREVTIVGVDEAIQSSTAKGADALVRIHTPIDASGNRQFYALGVVVTKSGFVLSDKRELIAGGSYSITLADGTTLPAALVSTSEIANLTLFKIQADPAHATKGFPTVGVSKIEAKLGQTVIALEGTEKTSVAVGRVLSVDVDTSHATTDVNPAGETFGGMLLNLSGELVGLKTSNDDLTLPPSTYLTIAPIQKLLSQAH
ncbi:serine protease [Candidatus Parcubacteria bacterium]|nr:serine protease [Candidatus Parcubacteria bacterium]